VAANDYVFVTQWTLTAPAQRVFEILKDGVRYAEWWRPAYRSTVKISEKAVACVVRARLPYTLRFTTELVREETPREILLNSTGELAGTGHWTLQQDGSVTRVRFDWRVRAEKPWMRFFSLILKPLFRWNHDWVMKTGERCLQRELDRR
jgi:Polyketide cyclase / dehydrase and lipid transport.